MKYLPWDGVIERLKHHRQRLKLSKDDCKLIIDFRYGKKFYQLSDAELVDFGKFLNGLSPVKPNKRKRKKVNK